MDSRAPRTRRHGLRPRCPGPETRWRSSSGTTSAMPSPPSGNCSPLAVADRTALGSHYVVWTDDRRGVNVRSVPTAPAPTLGAELAELYPRRACHIDPERWATPSVLDQPIPTNGRPLCPPMTRPTTRSRPSGSPCSSAGSPFRDVPRHPHARRRRDEHGLRTDRGGGRWQALAVVAVAELAQELAEHRGDDALAWIADRLAHGLDPVIATRRSIPLPLCGSETPAR